MPLFTVILSQIILRERYSKWVYLSLVPIVVGVVIASLTELSFDMIGLISALISTVGFSLQNIYSKKVLKDTGVHHLRLLHMLGRLALVMCLPVWAYVDFNVIRTPSLVFNSDYRVIMLLLCDGALNWLQNIIAFSVMSLVTPLTYSVSSAFKRIFVIGVSLFILGNPVTGLNVFGMALTILGVLAYNQAKMYTKKQQHTLLPMTTTTTTIGSSKSNGYVRLSNGGGVSSSSSSNGRDNNFYSSKQNLLLMAGSNAASTAMTSSSNSNNIGSYPNGGYILNGGSTATTRFV